MSRGGPSRSIIGMTSTSHPAVDLAAPAKPRPGLALALALISVPGVTIAWDIHGLAGLAGTVVGIVAVVLGLRARSAGVGTRMATAAVVIAGLAVLSVVFFLIVGPPD